MIKRLMTWWFFYRQRRVIRKVHKELVRLSKDCPRCYMYIPVGVRDKKRGEIVVPVGMEVK